MSAENKSVIIPDIEIDSWPNNFVDWCANCELLRGLVEGDVHLNISSKGYEGVSSVKVTPECSINTNSEDMPSQNALIRYDRVIHRGENRRSADYKMYELGLRNINVRNDVVCPATKSPEDSR